MKTNRIANKRRKPLKGERLRERIKNTFLIRQVIICSGQKLMVKNSLFVIAFCVTSITARRNGLVGIFPGYISRGRGSNLGSTRSIMNYIRCFILDIVISCLHRIL